MQQRYVVLYINPVNHAPGVEPPPPLHTIGGFHILTMGKTHKFLRNHASKSLYVMCVAMFSNHLYKSCQLGSIQASLQGPGQGSLAICSYATKSKLSKSGKLLQDH